ncbi:MAG: RNA-guided endonuclease TnpB family protein [Nitrososphaerales archaeon]
MRRVEDWLKMAKAALKQAKDSLKDENYWASCFFSHQAAEFSLKALLSSFGKERRVVNDILHKISRAIVNEALENDSMILIGELKGIRRNGKGKAFNRKLNNGFPYHMLSQFIEYKARWLGIKVVKVSERNTSKTCHKCRLKGLRVGSLFECSSCEYTCNADYNGAMNILKRAMGYMLIAWAPLTVPRTRYDEASGRKTENLQTSVVESVNINQRMLRNL